MLDPYRRVLSVPGARRFSATGVLARLPIAMVSLGIVLLVSEVRGSYGEAGAVSAVFLLANGLCAIVQGRLLDRIGQDRVLGTLAVLSGAALLLLMLAVQADWPMPTVYAAAAAAGATMPQVGSSVRARWSHVLDDPARLQTAFALEGALDESVFVAGPILVTVLATSVHPLAGLGTAVVVGTTFTLLLAAQRGTQPVATRALLEAPPRPAIPWRHTIPLALVALALGVMFGSAEVSTVAFAEESGDKSRAGILLALWALGSFTAGVATGAVLWRAGPATRVRWGALALVVVLAPLSLIGSAPVMGATLLVAGLAIAPTLIAALSLTEQLAPTGRLTEMMTVVHTAMVAGVAPGAALAGVVVDRWGASPAYLVALGAALLAAVSSAALPRTR